MYSFSCRLFKRWCKCKYIPFRCLSRSQVSRFSLSSVSSDQASICNLYAEYHYNDTTMQTGMPLRPNSRSDTNLSRPGPGRHGPQHPSPDCEKRRRSSSETDLIFFLFLLSIKRFLNLITYFSKTNSIFLSLGLDSTIVLIPFILNSSNSKPRGPKPQYTYSFILKLLYL